MRCNFIPGYLLDHLIRSDDQTLADCGRRTALINRRLGAHDTGGTPRVGGAAWEIYDAENGTGLPGRLVRTAGGRPVDDVTVNEAATGITESLALFADLGRSSFDGRGATVVTTVHYERDYDNAFWDGAQLVFGDGDGIVFGRFTKPIDVLGHELSHAVTQYTANFVYQDQSGALNESMSDVFGACLKQRYLGQDAGSADWLIGEGIFLPGVNGRALRSMTDPGTAYDDPAIGKDPQVGSMADYVITDDDNGGVHLNSGIPNRAFTIAARAIGGETWSGAGRIWYTALTSGVPANSDFATFASATVAVAGSHAAAVEDAWRQVGVAGAGAGVGAGVGGRAGSGAGAGAGAGAWAGVGGGAGGAGGAEGAGAAEAAGASEGAEAAGASEGAAGDAAAATGGAAEAGAAASEGVAGGAGAAVSEGVVEGVVEVARTGGFAGLTKQGAVDLESDDPRVPKVRELVDRIDFTTLDDPDPRPDRFTYRFRYLAIETQVHEPALTPDLLLLARLVLEE